MIEPSELLDTCRKLVPQSADPPPTQADLRRAISTAYYAVFHALAASNAELIAGQPQSSISAYAWERVYRRLDHGRAQNNLRAALNLLSPVGEYFARAFIELQSLRMEADYNPNAVIVRSDAVNARCPGRDCHQGLRPTDPGGTQALGRTVNVRPALTHAVTSVTASAAPCHCQRSAAISPPSTRHSCTSRNPPGFPANTSCPSRVSCASR